MAFVSDNTFEIELSKTLLLLEALKKDQTVFISTHKQMPQKEKVLFIQKIQRDQKTISAVIEKVKQQDLFNSGIKFKLENLKTRFSMLVTQWKKIENVI